MGKYSIAKTSNQTGYQASSVLFGGYFSGILPIPADDFIQALSLEDNAYSLFTYQIVPPYGSKDYYGNPKDITLTVTQIITHLDNQYALLQSYDAKIPDLVTQLFDDYNAKSKEKAIIGNRDTAVADIRVLLQKFRDDITEEKLLLNVVLERLK